MNTPMNTPMTQNERGEWVPAIPEPYFLALGRTRCHCGARFRGRRRYREHYALAHILDPIPSAGCHYGPHDPATAPTTVTVLTAHKYPVEVEVPRHPALIRQRQAINDEAGP